MFFREYYNIELLIYNIQYIIYEWPLCEFFVSNLRAVFLVCAVQICAMVSLLIMSFYTIINFVLDAYLTERYECIGSFSPGFLLQREIILRRFENRNETYIKSSRRLAPVRFERDSNIWPPACQSQTLSLARVAC